VLLKENPSMVIVYGDTNTTLGGALAASKLNIPVAHVEAGLRSFNRSMPEEVNRVLVDHVSTLLFSPTETGVNNLLKEGFSKETNPPYSADHPKIFHCGDVMYDTALYFLGKAEKSSSILERLNINGKDFALCTIHRNNNTDDTQRLTTILEALARIISEFKMPIVFPVHPRTAKMLAALPDREFISQLHENPLFIRIEPVGYLDMLMLESHSRLILTDSGGVQKEAYFFKKPCVVLRAETDLILHSFRHFIQHPPSYFPALFGDGEASAFICARIIQNL
jgi:UDP-GlcNAc3NAcA epimerase